MLKIYISFASFTSKTLPVYHSFCFTEVGALAAQMEKKNLVMAASNVEKVATCPENAPKVLGEAEDDRLVAVEVVVVIKVALSVGKLVICLENALKVEEALGAVTRTASSVGRVDICHVSVHRAVAAAAAEVTGIVSSVESRVISPENALTLTKVALP